MYRCGYLFGAAAVAVIGLVRRFGRVGRSRWCCRCLELLDELEVKVEGGAMGLVALDHLLNHFVRIGGDALLAGAGIAACSLGLLDFEISNDIKAEPSLTRQPYSRLMMSAT